MRCPKLRMTRTGWHDRVRPGRIRTFPNTVCESGNLSDGETRMLVKNDAHSSLWPRARNSVALGRPKRFRFGAARS